MATFTQRHYVAIASTLRGEMSTFVGNDEVVGTAAVLDVIYAMSEMFKKDNERFDADKFLNAAIVDMDNVHALDVRQVRAVRALM